VTARVLLLVRHGQSRWNVERRVQGQSGTGLSDLGLEQARLTAQHLAASHPDATLVTSDLERCVATVAPLEAALDRPAARDPRLRERDFGAFSGRLLTEIEETWPEVWGRWRAGQDVIAEVGGETSSELTGRVREVLLEVASAAPPGRPFICVTHGGPVWHGTHDLVGLPHGVLGAIGNASITRLELGGDGLVRLASFNELGHLPAEARTLFQPAGHARTAPPVGR
jgi:glucosyl-3-phosphoglycerate phosphatase